MSEPFGIDQVEVKVDDPMMMSVNDLAFDDLEGDDLSLDGDLFQPEDEGEAELHNVEALLQSSFGEFQDSQPLEYHHEGFEPSGGNLFPINSISTFSHSQAQQDTSYQKASKTETETPYGSLVHLIAKKGARKPSSSGSLNKITPISAQQRRDKGAFAKSKKLRHSHSMGYSVPSAASRSFASNGNFCWNTQVTSPNTSFGNNRVPVFTNPNTVNANGRSAIMPYVTAAVNAMISTHAPFQQSHSEHSGPRLYGFQVQQQQFAPAQKMQRADSSASTASTVTASTFSSAHNESFQFQRPAFTAKANAAARVPVSQADCQLHRACTNKNVTVEQVDNLLRRDPSAASKGISIKSVKPTYNPLSQTTEEKPVRESYRYPLNIAIKNKASPKVIEMLITAAPSVLLLKDGSLEECTLSILLKNPPQCPAGQDNGKVLVDLVDKILLSEPKCAAFLDRRRNTPVHVACMRAAPLDVFRHLHILYKEAFVVRNDNGNSPLDLAHQHTHLSEQVAAFLQEHAR